MHTKFLTLAIVATLTASLLGCGGQEPRRSSKKSKSSETSSTTTSSEKPSETKPAETASSTSTAGADTSAAAKSSTPAATGDWGTLKGKFVYNGPAPKAEKIDTSKEAFCMKKDLVEESFVVGKDGGFADVGVWVRSKDVKIHPDYEALKKEKVVIDNKQCRFEPRVLTYWTGQPLELKNSDPVSHNINATAFSNDPFNEIVPAEKSSERKPLEKVEQRPVGLNCSIHGWMKGFLIVQPHPYMAVSAKDGTFEIKNLPVGTELEFQAWQENGYIQKIEIDGKSTTWDKGRFKYTIKPGDNDLGTIKVDPTQFKKL
jgi:plastocyanin